MGWCFQRPAVVMPIDEEGEGRVRQVRDGRLHSAYEREIAQLIRHFSNPKLEGLTLFSIEVSADGSRIRAVCVPVSKPRHARAEVESALKRTAPYLRRTLAETFAKKKTPVVTLRYAPELAGPFPAGS